jgi:hypothetical protein
MSEKIDEVQKEKIKKEAKQLLDNFAKAIDKVSIKEMKEKKLVGGFREEGFGRKGNEDFRKIMFENAPSKEGDNIIVEKKKW